MSPELVDTWGAPEPEVEEALIKGKNGPIGSLHNVVAILESDTRWKDMICLDIFTGEIQIKDQAIDDHLETDICLWLERVYGLRANERLLRRALGLVARNNPVHSVKNWLNSLNWDKTERLPWLLSHFFGAKDTPLHQAMGIAWLNGAVARIMQPACKLDTMVVLVGKQGQRKSSGCAALMPRPQWFSDTALDLRNKDAFLQLRGIWLYEVAELRGMHDTNPDVIKSFLSSPCDNFRDPFGYTRKAHPRQCFFVGTTNDRNFLKDLTGSRRFWPVSVQWVDVEGIRTYRDQLWAEARVRFEAGEIWWLKPELEEELREVSGNHSNVDPWEEPLLAWAKAQECAFTVRQALDALRVLPERQDRRVSSRVGALLARFGCEQRHPAGKGPRPRVWWWPDRFDECRTTEETHEEPQ